MRRSVKWSLFALVALIASPFVSLGIYDVTEYQPRRDRIEQLLASATPDERKPSQSLKRLFRISLRDRTAAFAARVLVRELPVRTDGKVGWHATNLLWWGLVALHLNEDEQVALIASQAYMGNDRVGFSSEALARFGRPLAGLNEEQEATLVARSHAPSVYVKSPDRLHERKAWLLREMRKGS